jgi:hypothetical protein
MCLMEAKAVTALGVVLACLTAAAFYVSHAKEPRDALAPFSFPIDFHSNRRIREHHFRPTRTAAYLLVLDLGCPTTSSEEVFLTPDTTTLPFAWHVLMDDKVEAEGRLGSVRHIFGHPDLEPGRGQVVGRFHANVGQTYELLIDVEAVSALDSCNPRLVVPLVPDAYQADAVIAQLMHMAGTIFGLSSVLCFGLALVKRVRKAVPKANG